jgi:hypothetical protein
VFRSYVENYRTFFVSCGVPEYFSSHMYLFHAVVNRIILKIIRYIEALSKFVAELGEDKLQEGELKWVVSVLNELASDNTSSHTSVYLPTESLRLLPSNKVYFDDAKWAQSVGTFHQGNTVAKLDLILFLFCSYFNY